MCSEINEEKDEDINEDIDDDINEDIDDDDDNILNDGAEVCDAEMYEGVDDFD